MSMSCKFRPHPLATNTANYSLETPKHILSRDLESLSNNHWVSCGGVGVRFESFHRFRREIGRFEFNPTSESLRLQKHIVQLFVAMTQLILTPWFFQSWRTGLGTSGQLPRFRGLIKSEPPISAQSCCGIDLKEDSSSARHDTINRLFSIMISTQRSLIWRLRDFL
jgi:hypothetical protein